MHCLVEIGRVIFDSKYFHFIDVFSLFRYHLLLEKDGLFIWTNLNSLHPRMLCYKVDLNCPGGSGEEENVKSLPRWRHQRRPHRQQWRWTTDKLGSGELKTIAYVFQVLVYKQKCNLWKNNRRKYSVKLISIEWNDQNQQLTTLKWQMNFLNLKVTCRYFLTRLPFILPLLAQLHVYFLSTERIRV